MPSTELLWFLNKCTSFKTGTYPIDDTTEGETVGLYDGFSEGTEDAGMRVVDTKVGQNDDFVGTVVLIDGFELGNRLDWPERRLEKIVTE